MFAFFTKHQRKRLEAAKRLHQTVMTQSRQPDFYINYKIPDTLESRFEILALHGGLLVNRLCQPDMGAQGQRLAQTFFDVMFRDLDLSLREMGVGDLAIPRRIKKLMSSFKGRTFAYDEAMKSGEGEVKHALIRNIYGKVPAPYTEELEMMVAYMQECARTLAQQGLSELWQGKVHFPDLPEALDIKEIEGQIDHGIKKAA
ncbi:MAG: phage tail protein [Alphaproteobacteria bacterium]|nr:phage tail protein [Alphaproteobacteria bacterium]MCB9984610.1 phage tail protein [Micavibrio sp.]